LERGIAMGVSLEYKKESMVQQLVVMEQRDPK